MSHWERRARNVSDEQAVPALVEQLQIHDARKQRVAIQALGNLGEAASPALPHLLNLLHDSNENIRTEAIRALARLGSLAAQALIAANDHLDYNDREGKKVLFDAIVGLGPNTEALRVLVDNLSIGENVTEYACGALCKLGLPTPSATRPCNLSTNLPALMTRWRPCCWP
jgi:hypothetical protein